MSEEIKRLYRSRTDKVLFGVCGGLAKYFKIDPLLVRLGFILVGLLNGIGVIVYIVMALVVPEESESDISIKQ